MELIVCPSCGSRVIPEMPACNKCAERLFVEHIPHFPRDASAVHYDAYRVEPGRASG